VISHMTTAETPVGVTGQGNFPPEGLRCGFAYFGHQSALGGSFAGPGAPGVGTGLELYRGTHRGVGLCLDWGILTSDVHTGHQRVLGADAQREAGQGSGSPEERTGVQRNVQGYRGTHWGSGGRTQGLQAQILPIPTAAPSGGGC